MFAINTCYLFIKNCVYYIIQIVIFIYILGITIDDLS